MEKIDHYDILIISSFFGTGCDIFYHAPTSKNCVFFSNNLNIKDEIISKGWKFEFINVELSTDQITGSLQSKYIKFLQFLKDFDKYKKFRHILYFDHKFQVYDEHIDKIINILYENNNNPKIIIREHENISRKTIWDEVNESSFQDRYKKNMDKTIDLINNQIKNNLLVENIKLCNTGLIFYNNYDEIIPMLNDIYDTGIKQQQPQCQILWAIHSYKYLHLIKTVKFIDINPLWDNMLYYNPRLLIK
jgi:hypothetical protein